MDFCSGEGICPIAEMKLTKFRQTKPRGILRIGRWVVDLTGFIQDSKRVDNIRHGVLKGRGVEIKEGGGGGGR